MRNNVSRKLYSRSIVLAASLAVSVMGAFGCGAQDLQRDLFNAYLALLPGLPLPLPGPAGPAGPAGQDGQTGQDGVPGPNIIIARAVVNADGTLANTDDITVFKAGIGAYQLTVDVTGDVLPAGTTEDSFEVFVTLKEDSGDPAKNPYYVPVSLVGTTLRVDVFIENGDGRSDHAFSVTVLLPA